MKGRFFLLASNFLKHKQFVCGLGSSAEPTSKFFLTLKEADMSISSIQNPYYTPSALLDNSEKSDEYNETSRLIKETQEKNAAKDTSKTGSKPLSPGRRLLSASANAKEAIEQMRSRGVAINKENIAKELQTMEEGFQAMVKLGLKALGVDEKADFKVGVDESGKIIVNSEHADKDKIQKYFDDNPELADLFKNIEGLKNLKQVMVENSSKANPIEIRKSIQMESIDALFSAFDNNSNSSSSLFSPLILSYGNNSLSSFSGLNLKV